MIYSIVNKLNEIKKFPYYFISPLPYAIGNASEQILIAAGKAKKFKKKLVILNFNFFSKILKYNICNLPLFDDLVIDGFSQKKIKILKFILMFFLEIEFFFRRVFILINDIFFKFEMKEVYRFPNIGFPDAFESESIKENNIHFKKFNDVKQFDINYKLVDLEERVKSECENILNSFQIKKSDKIVCLHVRDGGYKKDYSRKSYRNSNINNYIKSIKYLIQKGFWVIRLGDYPTKKTKFKNKKFIDIPYSKIKSQEMDLYLIQRSFFYIGTQSGTLDVAYMFNKPVLLTNMCEMFASRPRKKNDRGIFKKIFDKKKKKFISIKKFINLPYKYHNPEIIIKDLKFIENSSEEIYLAVKEFLENFNNKRKLTKSSLQIKFQKLLEKRFYEIFYENDKTGKNMLNHTDAIKMIRMVKSSRGYFCNSYLKKIF